MLTALTVLGVLAALFLAAALATRDDEGLAPAPPDAADVALPQGRLRAEDVAGVRFGLALRGYRMSEVDAVLERLAGELAERDAELATLRGPGADDPGADGPGADDPRTDGPGADGSGTNGPGAYDPRTDGDRTDGGPAGSAPLVPAEPPLEAPPAPVVPPASGTSLQPPASESSEEPQAPADGLPLGAAADGRRG